MIVTLNQILLGASLDLESLKLARTFWLLGFSVNGLVKGFFLRERVLVLAFLALLVIALGEDVVILVVVAAVLFEFVFLLGFRGRFARGSR